MSLAAYEIHQRFTGRSYDELSIAEQAIVDLAEYQVASLHFAKPKRLRNRFDLLKLPVYLQARFADPETELRREIAITESMTKVQAKRWERLQRPRLAPRPL
jgi:hypothetical protein